MSEIGKRIARRFGKKVHFGTVKKRWKDDRSPNQASPIWHIEYDDEDEEDFDEDELRIGLKLWNKQKKYDKESKTKKRKIDDVVRDLDEDFVEQLSDDDNDDDNDDDSNQLLTDLVKSTTKKTSGNVSRKLKMWKLADVQSDQEGGNSDEGKHEEDEKEKNYSDDYVDDNGSRSRSVPKRKKNDVLDQKKRRKNIGTSRGSIEKMTRNERKKKENNNGRSGFTSLSDENINQKKEKNRNLEEDSVNSRKKAPMKKKNSGDSRNVAIKVESESDDGRTVAATTATISMEKMNVLDSFDVILPPSIVNGGDNSGGDQCTLLVEVSDPSDAIALGEFGGSVGAIGRFESDPNGITLDLKGNQYRGSLLPGPTCLVVGFPSHKFGSNKKEQSKMLGKQLRVEGIADEYATLVQIDDHMKKLDAIVTGNHSNNNEEVDSD